MKKLNVTLTSLLLVNSLFAQVTILEEDFSPTGVSNDGLVVGHYEQGSPYFLWNTSAGGMTEIGGVSAGDGVGGRAQFSADGKYISGSMLYDMAINTEWEKNKLSNCDYSFTDVSNVPKMKAQAFMIGKGDTDGRKGVILSTSNGGTSWKKSFYTENGLEAICFITDQVGLIGGENGTFKYTTNRGNEWRSLDPRPAECTDEVKSYKAIDFIQSEPYNGVVGAELADGKYAVYQSSDGAETWTKATGVEGIPLCITHVGGTFFMGTKNGLIQKSIDNGVTWKKIFKTGGSLEPAIPIYKIKFIDENIGLAATDVFVYRTSDGGATWNVSRLDDNLLSNAKIYDILWIDNEHVIAVGSRGLSYQSADAGITWTKMEIETDGQTDLKTITMSEQALNICGANGTVYHQSRISSVSVGCMGRYSVENGIWTPLGGLGFHDQSSTSSGYAISGDGKTVVGLAQIGDRTNSDVSPFAHATAWNEEAGMIDLGSLYDNIGRSTRANAVNYDGSVIVGWQDQKGPWSAAVWYKNDAGGYNPNEYILIDPASDPEIELNKAREASAVSLDGTWIGGRGMTLPTSGPLSILEDDQAIRNQPWLWSQKTGFQRLGMIKELKDNPDAYAYVRGINNDGSVAVGFIIVGNYMYGFIWTKDGGMMSVNEYLTEVLKYDIGNRHFASILSMSPNGRYIAGWGINDDTTLFACQIDLLYQPSGIKAPGQAESIVTVYPNPVSDVLHVDLPFEGESQIRLVDVQGRVVINEKTTLTQNSLPVSDIESGLYILEVISQGIHKTHKVRINH